ncbi:unnamed protein product [Adineta ricciae]|uniref:F-box domain-containing protein n=1 Tax=Adineta ricciae TaxID=249248 RepID=A0A815SVV3_ADIRI|nr:unnamed protein product [Adineta ricciae]
MKTTIDQLCPDIWQYVFEYFHARELFTSLIHVTKAADDVLLNENQHFSARTLVIDTVVRTPPKELMPARVISLELYEDSRFNTIRQYFQLRSLKLIGDPQWIIYVLKQISQNNKRLEQLTFLIPSIGFLYDLLASISVISSLRRLEIRADQFEEKIKVPSSFVRLAKIEQFILHSCSSISWNELLYMSPHMSNVRFLDITLIKCHNNLLNSFTLPKLRSLFLILIEIPFELIIQLVTTAPSLVKLKLNGLVDEQGFVINHKWSKLFESCSSLKSIIVSVSLEQSISSYYSETIRESLHRINLTLNVFDDDSEYYLDTRQQNHWWKLSGVIIQH